MHDEAGVLGVLADAIDELAVVRGIHEADLVAVLEDLALGRFTHRDEMKAVTTVFHDAADAVLMRRLGRNGEAQHGVVLATRGEGGPVEIDGDDAEKRTADDADGVNVSPGRDAAG